MRNLSLAILLFSALLPTVAIAEDYNVEDLPFYQIGQLEKEKLYIKTATNFIKSPNALLASKYISVNSPKEVSEFTKVYRQLHKGRTGELKKDLIVFGHKTTQFAHITMDTSEGVQSVVQMVWERNMDSPKIDWRATYGYSETDWDEFFKEKPQLPTPIRVRLTEGDYYNYQFSDDKKWACLKCFHPFLNKELFAYVKRDDPLFTKTLESIAIKNHVDLIIEMCYPDPINDWKQVEIVRVLQRTWYNKNYYAQDLGAL